MKPVKDPEPVPTKVPPRRRGAGIENAKTQLAIPAARSGFRAPEKGPTESLSSESSTKNKRPKLP